MQNPYTPVLRTACNTPMILDSGIQSVTLEILPTAAREVNSKRFTTLNPKSARKVQLHFEDITGTGVPPIYDIYLNVSVKEELSDKFYAGSLPFYGIDESSTPCLEHGGTGQHYVLDVSELFDKLSSLTDWSGKYLKISLESTKPMPVDASVTIGRISLYFN